MSGSRGVYFSFTSCVTWKITHNSVSISLPINQGDEKILYLVKKFVQVFLYNVIEKPEETF